MTTAPCPACGRLWPASTALSGGCPACLLAFAFSPEELASEEHAPEPAPLRLGPYTILEPLGRGGMGAVFKARHDALDRVVALKLLVPELSRRPGFPERFCREGQVLASLDHPNIVGVHDTGCEAGTYYMAMEHVVGCSLRERMSAGPIPLSDVVSLFDTLCNALQYAHDRGIVHRDVKPENILLDQLGRAHVADFGIAKLVGESAVQSLTATGAALGTWCYMAPEQLEGGPVDTRADVYSLAVVLYEVVTGERPLGAFEPPSRKAAVSPRLDAVLAKALSREPGNRFATVRDFQAAVREATTARRPRMVRRLAATLGLVMMLAIALISWRGTSNSPTSGTAPGLPLILTGHAGAVDSVSFSRDGRRVASAAEDRTVRFWSAVDGKAEGELPGALPGHEPGQVCVVHVDDRTLATAGRENAIRVWDLVSRNPSLVLAKHTREVTALAAAQDGRRLASASLDGTVRVWDLARGETVRTLTADAGNDKPHPPLSVALANDGRLVAAGLMNGAVLLWDVETGEPIRLPYGHGRRVRSVTFASDGTLASSSHDGTIRLWPQAFPGPIETHAEVWSVAFSPDGRTLASGQQDGVITLWDVRTSRRLRVLAGHAGKVASVDFSPDGTRLVSGGDDRTVRLWRVELPQPR